MQYPILARLKKKKKRRIKNKIKEKQLKNSYYKDWCLVLLYE